MKKSKLMLKKITQSAYCQSAIEIRTNSGDAMGLITCDQCFIPCPDVELYPAEIRAITAITDNFWMFYDNMKEEEGK